MNENNLKRADVEDVVWDSKIPLQLELADQVSLMDDTPITLYFSFPRIGYLSSILIEVKHYLEKYEIDAKLNEIWLEYKKTPLKWHIPFGIIYDCLNMKDNQGMIPISIHRKDFPTQDLFRYENLDLLRFYYMNTLKEANLIKYPKDSVIKSLNNNVVDLIKKIIMSNESNMRSEYRQVMNSIDKGGHELYDKYPVKIVIEPGKTMITKSIKIQSEDYCSLTLDDYLSRSLKNGAYDAIKSRFQITIQGIDMNNPKALSIPFLFYYLNMTYLDNFLYIILKAKDS